MTATRGTERQFFPSDREPTRGQRALVQIPFFAMMSAGAIAARIGDRAFDRWASAIRALDARARLPDPKPGTVIEQAALPHCGAEIVRAPGVTNRERAILYLHGGGFLGGSARTYRPFVTRLSGVTDALVLNVDYRLMPQVKVSDAIADGVDGYRWLLEKGYAPDHIIVAGDSAGGHLAFSVPLKILQDGLPAPGGIVAISPWLDFDTRAKRAHANAKLDPMIPISGVDFVVRRLIAENGQLDPLLSPVNGELTELPPSLIQVGSTEVLLLDSETMGERLEAAGVPCRLQVFEHQFHCFQVLDLPGSLAWPAIDEIARFVDARLSD